MTEIELIFKHRKHSKILLKMLKILFKYELNYYWMDGYDSGFEDGFYK